MLPTFSMNKFFIPLSDKSTSDLSEDKGCFQACDENLQTDHEGTAAGH